MTRAKSSFEKKYLDLVGPLSESWGMQYALVMCCDLAKFSIAASIPSKDSTTVSEAFVHHFVLQLGVPKVS